MWRRHRIEPCEDLLLLGKMLDDRLDADVTRAELIQVGGEPHETGDALDVCVAQFAAGEAPPQ